MRGGALVRSQGFGFIEERARDMGERQGLPQRQPAMSGRQGNAGDDDEGKVELDGVSCNGR